MNRILFIASLSLTCFFTACNEKKAPAPEKAVETKAKSAQSPQVNSHLSEDPSHAGHDHGSEVIDPAPWEMEGMGYKYFDYSIPMTSIKGGENGLKSLAGSPAVVFLFSATCPHCKVSYPQLADSVAAYLSKGLKVYAIASANNSNADIATFVKEQNVQLPLLQDTQRAFSKNYGVGTVPLTLWIHPDGRYMKFPSFAKGLPVLMHQIAETLK